MTRKPELNAYVYGQQNPDRYVVVQNRATRTWNVYHGTTRLVTFCTHQAALKTANLLARR